MKRATDLLVGSMLSLISAPLIALLAIWSLLAFRAFPFFVQERRGVNGTVFKLIKIRTLPAGKLTTATKYQLRESEIPRSAWTIRDRHLDELPQVWNVVLGTMSLVGPRPFPVHNDEVIPPEFDALRRSVLPGCTGLWQISPDASRLVTEAQEYDRLYVARGTWRLDLWILLRTPMALLGISTLQIERIPAWLLARAPGDERTDADEGPLDSAIAS